MSGHNALVAQESGSDAMPVRRGDVILEELDGEAVLYDSRYGAVHRFNAVTLCVWDLCDGAHTPADIVRRITQLCRVDPDEARDSVQRVLAELATLDLVEGASVEPMNKTRVPWWTKAPCKPAAPFRPPTSSAPEVLRLSRRELLGSGVSKLVFIPPVISTFFAVGAYASGGSGLYSWDCKFVGFSCIVKDDCCGSGGVGMGTDCQAGACCKEFMEPCTADAECCSGGCMNSTCDN